jgi:hypothetical protein
MKYKFTVWNVIIALLIPFVVVILIKKDTNPNTVLGAAYLIPVLVVGAVIDLLLQVLIKNRKVLAIVELVSLVTIIIINQLP